MKRKILFILVISGLILTACSTALSALPGEESPSSAPGFMSSGESATSGGGEDFAGNRAFDSDTGQGTSPISNERIVIKNADLSIAVDDPVQSMEKITRMVEEMGGYVVSSNLWYTTLESGLEVPRASITFRIPAEKFLNALDEIEAGAGRMLSRNESGQDVTSEYTDLQSRLRNLRQAEEQLGTIMDEAKRTEDVLSVYTELNRIREQIEVIQGQIQYYEQSAAFSAISVEILADAAVQPLTIGGWEPVGVAKDAIQSLINTLKFLVNVAIWLVLYMAPIVIILYFPVSFVWKGLRRWRSRRKERAQEKRSKPSEED